MSEKMKALVLNGPNDYVVTDVPKPVIGDDEILLRHSHGAFCGNDIRSLNGMKKLEYPRFLCHEYAGVVAEVGKNVKGYEVGDRVAVVCIVPCGKCYYCSVGLNNLCNDRLFLGEGWCEYSKIPAEAIRRGGLMKLPDGISLEEGALLEPMSCAMQGVRQAGVKLGDTVLVVGAGTMGMLNIELCILAGASKVIVSDLAADRRQRALDWGATRVVDPTKEDLAKVIDEETGGEGCDVTILAIGVTSMVNELFKMTKKGGVCYLFAGFAGDTNTTIDVNLIHYKQIWVSGNSGSTMLDYMICRDLVLAKKFDLKKYITHNFSLTQEDFESAYKVAREGGGLKVNIKFFDEE